MSATTTVLRGGGTALVLAHGGRGLPAVLHWGADLGDDDVADLSLVGDRPVAHNALDEPWDLSVLPGPGDGWLGTPGLEAHRGGGAAAPRWTASVEGGGDRAVVRAESVPLAATLELVYALDPHGVLTVSSSR